MRFGQRAGREELRRRGARRQHHACAQQEGPEPPQDQNHLRPTRTLTQMWTPISAHQHDRQRHVHHPPDPHQPLPGRLEPELELEPSQQQRLRAKLPIAAPTRNADRRRHRDHLSRSAWPGIASNRPASDRGFADRPGGERARQARPDAAGQAFEHREEARAQLADPGRVAAVDAVETVDESADQSGQHHDHQRQVGGGREMVSPLKRRVKQDHRRAHQPDENVEPQPRSDRPFALEATHPLAHGVDEVEQHEPGGEQADPVSPQAGRTQQQVIGGAISLGLRQQVVALSHRRQQEQDAGAQDRERHRPASLLARRLDIHAERRVRHRSIAMMAANADADRLEELGGQLAAQAGDHEVVGDPRLVAALPGVHHHRVRLAPPRSPSHISARTRPAAQSASSFCLFCGRQRPNSGRR